MNEYRAANELVDIIITCADGAAVAASLRELHIEVTGLERAIVGSISARAKRDQFKLIENLPGVDAVEVDEDMQAL